MRPLTPGKILAARIIAVVADFVQLSLLPMLPLEAVMWPVVDILDVVVALVLTWLVGWHWAFLPSFLLELVPFVDFAPTWTVAVFIVTRHGAAPDEALAPAGSAGTGIQAGQPGPGAIIDVPARPTPPLSKP